MGLDSVELLMDIENYFGIKIPDSEAETIYTIQTMIDCVARHLNVTNDSKDLRDSIFEKVALAFQELVPSTQKMELSDLISNYISSTNNADWEKLEALLNLSVPKPDVVTEVSSNKISDKLKSLFSWKPLYDWNLITVEQFVTVICAANFKKMVSKESVKSKYEIYIAVIGLTVDKVGVEYYEVTPEKSFTSDLGVD